MSEFDKPELNTAEIALIGTGGGYGESIIIHLGNDEWAVIDSCRDPSSKEVLPLEYLNAIGVNYDQVKLIVCTHWHDDHIRGISDIFDVCKNAIFSFAKCSSLRQFCILLSAEEVKTLDRTSLSSTVEFKRCLEINKLRGSQFSFACVDKILYANAFSSIYSLSPSDATQLKFDAELTQLIKISQNRNRKLLSTFPNHRSIASLLMLGPHCALLGADLEKTKDNNEGWDNIIDSCQSLKNKKSSFFKIPHHGSDTGYHQGVWQKVLQNKPVSTLSPWNKNSKLPKEEMLKKYLDHTDQLFITCNIHEDEKPKKRSKEIQKLIKEVCDQQLISIQHIPLKKGIIRGRISLIDKESVWDVKLFEKAKKVSRKINSNEILYS